MSSDEKLEKAKFEPESELKKEDKEVLVDTKVDTESTCERDKEVKPSDIEPETQAAPIVEETAEEAQIEPEKQLFGSGQLFEADFKDEKTSFKMYERFSTYEDADPYIDNELLVVCDGTGGAGASKHQIPTEKINTLEKIKEIILPEDTNGCLDEHLDTLFKPIFESKEEIQKRTSAFFGSRIVLPRFVYAMHLYSDAVKDSEKIIDFTVKGLRDFADKFDLRKDIFSKDSSLLPTTLVAIKVEKETKDEVEFTTFCAGDSRAYMLSKDGLQQLTQDDEHDEGITNYFAVKDAKIYLNSRHYRVKKPCLLFVCSDGIFDASKIKDYLKLEYALIGFMLDSSDMSAWRDNLKKLYADWKGDDCTLAMRSFGYESFEQMKSQYKEMAEKDLALINKQNEYRAVYEVKSHPEVLTQKVQLLISRTNDKYDAIVDVLKNGVETGLDDPFINQMKEKLSSNPIEEARCVELKNQIETKRIFLKTKIAKSMPDKIFRTSDFIESFSDNLLSESKAKEFEILVHRFNKIRDYYLPNAVMLKIWNILSDIYEKLRTYLKVTVDEKKPKESKMNVFNDDVLSEDIRTFLISINRNDLVDEYDKACELKNKTGIGNKVGKKITNLRIDFCSFLEANISDIENMIVKPLNDDMAQALIELKKVKQEYEDLNNTVTKIRTLYDAKDGPSKIVSDRLELGSNVNTVIDAFYSPAILIKALQYYAVQNDKDEFGEAYNAFNANATKLIS